MQNGYVPINLNLLRRGQFAPAIQVTYRHKVLFFGVQAVKVRTVLSERLVSGAGQLTLERQAGLGPA
jgi:hypothetical protein